MLACVCLKIRLCVSYICTDIPDVYFQIVYFLIYGIQIYVHMNVSIKSKTQGKVYKINWEKCKRKENRKMLNL